MGSFVRRRIHPTLDSRCVCVTLLLDLASAGRNDLRQRFVMGAHNFLIAEVGVCRRGLS